MATERVVEGTAILPQSPGLQAANARNQQKQEFCCIATTCLTTPGLAGRSVVDLGIRIGRFKLIAGRQHGQPGNHAVHVEAVRAAGAGLFTILR